MVQDIFLNFSRQNISADKIFGGQYFRQQAKFLTLLSAEILSDMVTLQRTLQRKRPNELVETILAMSTLNVSTPTMVQVLNADVILASRKPDNPVLVRDDF